MFKADLTNKKIINKEPDKCEELDFFYYNKLPHPTINYISEIIDKAFSTKNPWIYEEGWDF
ncbi:MAG: hypothetical protein GY830_03860 [Bacteroidetes bacterium]|nr:hypothetical protein [Bacteroidota bacterium]